MFPDIFSGNPPGCKGKAMLSGKDTDTHSNLASGEYVA